MFICGTKTQAMEVARRAGLKPNEWEHLHWFQQLMGYEEPNVVLLDTFTTMRGSDEILDELYARSAVCWSELDLINGKVPR